jgi:hypothetical protein
MNSVLQDRDFSFPRSAWERTQRRSASHSFPISLFPIFSSTPSTFRLVFAPGAHPGTDIPGSPQKATGKVQSYVQLILVFQTISDWQQRDTP